MFFVKKNKTLIIILFYVIIANIIFICRYKIYNQISIWVDNRLDYERTLDVGDEFNKVVWGDLSFQINHYKSGNKLDYVKNNKKISLLTEIRNYKISENKLYIVSNEGCAVVEGNNTAKIYIISENKFIFEDIVYLNSFDEFEETEQAILNKLL